MALLRKGKKKGRRGNGVSPVAAGAVLIVLVAFISFFGFTKANPFASPFELTAVFKTANNLQPKSPVRIAGVDVGKVESVDPLPGGTGGVKVKMTIDKLGLPIHKDAQIKIRPRIFLEGNFFVDVQPGSPSTPNVHDGDTIPVNQTATPVQLDQVLATLQTDTRKNLRTLLAEYAIKGFGNGGAEAYNRTLDSSPGALRDSSKANEATLGQQPHDLSYLERGQQRLFSSLSSNPQNLQDLIVKLNQTAAALASRDVALRQTVPALRDTLRAGTPALASLDSALPSLRRFARTALPATISSGPTIDASLPTITQLRLLVRPSELRGLVRDLVPTIPALAQLNSDTIPLLDQNRALSACQNKVLLPFSKTPIPDPEFPGNTNQPFYKQAPRSFVGLAGESRFNDANTPYFHVQPGVGATTVVTKADGRNVFAAVPQAPEAVRPAKGPRPAFWPNAPCELQQIPDLNAPGGPPDRAVPPLPSAVGGLNPPLPLPLSLKIAAQGKVQLSELKTYLQRSKAHEPAVSPMGISQQTYVQRMKQIGLGVTPAGKVFKLAKGARR
ncbi:MAG: hypothetical protein NVSMB25_23650 [Thermoleophilaceae bacterium]